MVLASIDWGDMATWVSAVGTLAAVIVALSLARRDADRQREALRLAQDQLEKQAEALRLARRLEHPGAIAASGERAERQATRS